MEQKDHVEILKELSKPLTVDQVDFRIQSISENGYATFLAYKDARTDMNRLDQVLGAYWQDKYELIDGQLFCSIGIKIKDEWIWRQDVGTESQTEKEKGRASDSFKRAGFRFGIGRELYDYPRIFLQLKGASDVTGKAKPEFTVKQSGQKKIGTAGWGLDLKKWKWELTLEDKSIKRLVGKDQTGAVRYDSNKNFNSLPKGNHQQQEPKAEPQTQKLKELVINSDDWKALVTFYGKGKKSSVANIKTKFMVTAEVEKELNVLIEKGKVEFPSDIATESALPKITQELFKKAKTFKTKAPVLKILAEYSMADEVRIALKKIADGLK